MILTKEELEREMKEFWSYENDPDYREGWHPCGEGIQIIDIEEDDLL